MNLDMSDATNALQVMIAGFVMQLPNIILGVIIFVSFFFLGKFVRNLVRKIAERNQQHYSLGLILGRLAQSAIFFLELLIALVIAIPSFKASQLVNVLGLSSVAFGFALFYKTF